MKLKCFVAVFLCALMGVVQAKDCKDSTTVGSWFDGEAVAENPDGEDYAADSGSNLMLGCTRLLDQNYRYTANYSLGYRYQLDKSGKGRNSGWSIEASMTGNWGGLLLGGGGIYQFKGVVRDYFGLKTKIEPSLGAFVFVGLSLSPGLQLQVRRHFMPLESEGGAEFEASEYGIFLHRAF